MVTSGRLRRAASVRVSWMREVFSVVESVTASPLEPARTTVGVVRLWLCMWGHREGRTSVETGLNK